MGLKESSPYSVTEVFDGTVMGNFKTSDNFKVYVNPTGVFFGKAVPNKGLKYRIVKQSDKPGML